MSSIHLQHGNPFSAGRCMDGKNIGDDSICRTEKELSPWIAFDFGEEVEVGSVVIFSGQAGRTEKIMNLDVRITFGLPEDRESKFTGGTLLGSFNGTLKKCQRILIKSLVLLKGRYVFIQMNHRAKEHLSFQEVAIFKSTEISTGIFSSRIVH